LAAEGKNKKNTRNDLDDLEFAASVRPQLWCRRKDAEAVSFGPIAHQFSAVVIAKSEKVPKFALCRGWYRRVTPSEYALCVHLSIFLVRRVIAIILR
jgi:hypothetical protein